MNFSVITNHPVAVDSLDHTHPCGAARDNSANQQFNWKVTEFFQNRIRRGEREQRTLRVLDIGCAGGAFVKTMLEDGWDAIGIEGSDYPLKNSLFNWPELHGKNLFTCDATKPFDIKIGYEYCQFDLITAWEVMEHIAEKDLSQFLTNVDDALAPDGLFVCSISSVDSPHAYDGEDVDLRVTQKDHGWWIERFASAGFIHRPDISSELGTNRIRYGDMSHVGPRIESTKTGYEDFSYGNYVFSKV